MLKMVAGDGAWLTRDQLSAPISLFSTMYPKMRPPPSEAGLFHDKLTKSPPTSETSGMPGLPGSSVGGVGWGWGWGWQW